MVSGCNMKMSQKRGLTFVQVLILVRESLELLLDRAGHGCCFVKCDYGCEIGLIITEW